MIFLLLYLIYFKSEFVGFVEFLIFAEFEILKYYFNNKLLLCLIRTVINFHYFSINVMNQFPEIMSLSYWICKKRKKRKIGLFYVMRFLFL